MTGRLRRIFAEVGRFSRLRKYMGESRELSLSWHGGAIPDAVKKGRTTRSQTFSSYFCEKEQRKSTEVSAVNNLVGSLETFFVNINEQARWSIASG